MRGLVAAMMVISGVAGGCSRDAAPPSAAEDASSSASSLQPPPPQGGGEGDAGISTAFSSPSSSAATTSSPSSASATTAAPPPLPVTTAVAVAGAQESPLAREGVTTVDPAAAFRVEVATRLTDGRLALLDEADAMVGSTGTTELGGSYTRYRLTPAEALRPGSRYRLRLEGAVTREAHDVAGRAYGPVVHELRTSGERPAAPAPKRRRGRP